MMRLIILATFLFPIVAAHAQKPKAAPSKPKVVLRGPEIKFRKKIHDFGRINIEIQYARTKFYFINTGDQPLIVTDVKTSCGCTTPDWSKDSVKPGDSGFVEARYETINRPGEFKKTITVYTNAKNTPFVQLDIIGDVFRANDVTPKEKAPDYGRLYFSEETLDFTKTLYNNGTDTIQVRLYNASLFSTDFQPIGTLPPFCKIEGMPKSLEPSQNALITVILDGRMIKGYGFSAFEIPVTSNNPMSPLIGMKIAYKRKQYFPKMSVKELKKAPKIVFGKGEMIDFGTRTSGDILDTVFTITNAGKQNLVLHEVYPECSCLTIKFDKTTLLPGETMKVTVTYDTVLKRGQATQSIWIVSNDPTAPEKYVYIRAHLPKPDKNCTSCPD